MPRVALSYFVINEHIMNVIDSCINTIIDITVDNIYIYIYIYVVCICICMCICVCICMCTYVSIHTIIALRTCPRARGLRGQHRGGAPRARRRRRGQGGVHTGAEDEPEP